MSFGLGLNMYDQMLAMAGLKSLVTEEEIAYRTGVIVGYTKDDIKANCDEVKKNESIYTDGLMVGLGITTKVEYNQIIKESEERQRLQSRSLRSKVKNATLGMMYDMTDHMMKSGFADYAVADTENTQELIRELGKIEEEKEEE